VCDACVWVCLFCVSGVLVSVLCMVCVFLWCVSECVCVCRVHLVSVFVGISVLFVCLDLCVLCVYVCVCI